MAAKDDDHKGQPPRHANNPNQPPGQADKPQPKGPPAPTHREPAEPVPGQSQKSQIAQYFKSQGKQPDDVVFSIGGMNLTVKDLDG